MRHVPLEGCLNLRDLGGYATSTGAVVRHGCLFRSDELHALTDTDVETFAELGVRVVFDLRTHEERQLRPSRLPPHVEVLVRQAPPTGRGTTQTTEELIASGAIPEHDDDEFARHYVDLLDVLAPDLRVVVECALDAPSRPLLFHCAAGKDRTGLAAALLLGLLGVPDDVILDDYELTNTLAAPRRLEALAAVMAERGLAEERVLPLLQARRPVLAFTLRHLHDKCGGYEGYARDQLDLDPTVPTQLRAALLVSP